MPIDFRDADEIGELGAAGYLEIDTRDEGRIFRGALFLVNARGEPLEFTYNKIETPSSFLWRQDDIRRHATRRLVISLFDTCQKTPKFLICLANEIGYDLFCNEIHVAMPVCRAGSSLESISHSSMEIKTTLEEPEPLHLFWFPEQPGTESLEHRLLSRLSSTGLLLEPFERALAGLREVYPSPEDHADSGTEG